MAHRLAALGERIDGDLIVAVDAAAGDLSARAAVADLLLVDSTDEEGAGGTGETHDWAQTRAVVEQFETPVALAGGLTPDNVGKAVDSVGPFAVDTASGVEATGGTKDHEAVRRFVERARRPEVSA